LPPIVQQLQKGCVILHEGKKVNIPVGQKVRLDLALCIGSATGGIISLLDSRNYIILGIPILPLYRPPFHREDIGQYMESCSEYSVARRETKQSTYAVSKPSKSLNS